MTTVLPQCPKCEQRAVIAVTRESDSKDELVCCYCRHVDHEPDAMDVVDARKAETDWHLRTGEWPSWHWARVVEKEKAKIQRLKQGRW